MDKKQYKASLIILNYSKSKRVTENVESIYKQKVNFPFEVIVVDNSCNYENQKKLKTLQKFPDFTLQINKRNLGYIGGNNLGVSLASGEYILIVNPDILMKDDNTLQKMVDFMESNTDIGVCGPKQVNDSGDIAMTVRAFPKLFLQIARRTFLRNWPIIKGWVAYDEMRHLDYDKMQDVDWLQSSFWIIKRATWEKLGGLDTSYYIFMSDPALCFKCWEKGLRVVYNPEFVVYADGKRVSEGGLKEFFLHWVLRQHLKDAIVYQFKHWGKKNPRFS